MRFLALLFFFFPLLVQASDGNTGIGVILGTPYGVTARHWFDKDKSVDASLGWSMNSPSKFHVYSDYLWSKEAAIKIGEADFDGFFGAGLSVRTKSGNADGEVVFGPRVPVGMSYEFANPDIEVFVQAAMNLGLIPSADIYFDAGIGARFYF